MVLVAQAPDLHEALEKVAEQGWSHVMLDRTVLRSAAAPVNAFGLLTDQARPAEEVGVVGCDQGTRTSFPRTWPAWLMR